jgi:type IV pilus assembly protein PilM
MLSLFGNKKLKAFGLDISDQSLKVMQLDTRGNSLVPRAFAQVNMPDNIIANHQISNQDKLSEYITRAITAARNINTKYVVTSVPETKSFVRIISIPKMPMSEIDGAIPWELEQDIPVPIDQVYTDWQVINEREDKYDVLVTATPKDYIDALVETLKLAGLKPVALELESQATARALISKEDANDAVLVLDMSAALTSFIVVINGGVLEYTSSIPIAGNAFTESIARTLGVSNGEAEKIKKESGLMADSKKGNIRQAMIPILDNIVDEIKNVIRFHEEHSWTEQKINKVLLCGGTSRLNGIADYISARLNLGSGRPIGHISLGDPWINVATNEEDRKSIPINTDDSLSYTTAVGLALRGARLDLNQ